MLLNSSACRSTQRDCYVKSILSGPSLLDRGERNRWATMRPAATTSFQLAAGHASGAGFRPPPFGKELAGKPSRPKVFSRSPIGWKLRQDPERLWPHAQA